MDRPGEREKQRGNISTLQTNCEDLFRGTRKYLYQSNLSSSSIQLHVEFSLQVECLTFTSPSTVQWSSGLFSLNISEVAERSVEVPTSAKSVVEIIVRKLVLYHLWSDPCLSYSLSWIIKQTRTSWYWWYYLHPRNKQGNAQHDLRGWHFVLLKWDIRQNKVNCLFIAE